MGSLNREAGLGEITGLMPDGLTKPPKAHAGSGFLFGCDNPLWLKTMKPAKSTSKNMLLGLCG
jgi:hypothetical protein